MKSSICAACLESVAFADEVWVVDSASSDRTAEIALEYGARLAQFEYTGGFPKKKNWALANLPFRNEWILLIDADERVTPELETEIRTVLELRCRHRRLLHQPQADLPRPLDQALWLVSELEPATLQAPAWKV
jgi:glycosyltransferase involved in cell wall biosynthesis